jgi:ArsR family transcriptional regulator
LNGEAAQVFAALGHPLRLRMVTFLASRPRGGAYVSDVVAHVRRAQSTVSHHLRVLTDAGLLTTEPHGPWSWYRVVPSKLAELGEHLSMLSSTMPVPGTGVVI